VVNQPAGPCFYGKRLSIDGTSMSTLEMRYRNSISENRDDGSNGGGEVEALDTDSGR
jgi:hypothetical protein